MSQLNQTRQGKNTVGKMRRGIANTSNVNKHEMLDGIFKILSTIQERQNENRLSASTIRSRCGISRKKLMNYLEKMQESDLIDGLRAPTITRKGANYLACYANLNRRIVFIREKYFSENPGPVPPTGDDFVHLMEGA